MTNESRDPREQFTARWVRACATGWIGGLALVLLLAVLWDLVGGVAQFMVGVGMGAGVGWSQSRVLRHWLIKPGSWVLASTVGMGAPFVLSDIVALLGGSIYALSWCAVVGGAIAGVWQARLLRDNVSHTGRWWLWSMLGWAAKRSRASRPVVRNWPARWRVPRSTPAATVSWRHSRGGTRCVLDLERSRSRRTRPRGAR
jgi:hypothetical protein